MLNAEKIGSFIAAMRREKGLTQKQLAGQLGVSDKTVSKWETGRGIPDNGILVELSKALCVDVNELLSGERLSQATYQKRAEENVVTLIEQAADEKHSRHMAAICVLGGILLMAFIYIIEIFMVRGDFYWYMDWRAVLGTMLFPAAVLLLSGKLLDFGKCFLVCLGRRKVKDKKDFVKMRNAFRLVLVVLPVGSLILMLIDLLAIFAQTTQLHTLLVSMGAAVLPVIYSLSLDVLLLAVYVRMERFHGR